MSKRDTLSVQIKWFYRTNEVPETVYQFLIQNRQTEHKIYHKALALTEKAALSEAAAANNVTTANNCEIKKSKRPKLNDGMLRLRELFVSESTDMHPVSVLRGLCKVYQCHDIKDVEEFTANDNTFFFRLSYNPETRRLASTHGEIQVGASHQVRFVCLTVNTPHIKVRGATATKASKARALPKYWVTVNPISTRGADFAHHSTIGLVWLKFAVVLLPFLF